MTFVTGRHIPRRSFLRGAGTAIALPFLDAMVPAFARAAATKAPVRMAFLYVPNGIVMKQWTPATEGANFEFPRILKALEPFREDLLVLTGLAHRAGEGSAGDHARAAATFLTGVTPKKTTSADIEVGISVDQVAAQAIGARTRLRSLGIGMRSPAHSRELRLRVQLRLYQQHVVERAHHTESPGDQSASGFRAALWHPGGEQRPPGSRPH
jgi:Protein of unknown function (DUF1552)